MDYKKILAVLTAAIGTVAMADEIVSSSVVGYTTTTLADDSQAVACGFIDVGGSGINLTSIKPEADGTCNGDIYIEILDSLGYTTDTYYWYQNARGKNDGWYNDDGDMIGEDVDDISFAPGVGLWLTGIDGDTITTAGQVYSADLSVTLQDDSQMLGNPYATSIGLAANIEVEADGTCNSTLKLKRMEPAMATSTSRFLILSAIQPTPTTGIRMHAARRMAGITMTVI